jgi:hypothetical protein
MNSYERELLSKFLNQLAQMRGISKDAEAEAMIQRCVAQQPDAAYLLVQRAMLLEQALNNAKAWIAQLEGQLQATGRAETSGFLGSPSGWGAEPVLARPGAVSRYGAPTQDPWGRRSYAPSGGPFGSFLGTAAATAAGVVGGAFLLEGIQNLLGMDEAMHTAELPASDTAENMTVSNYYGEGSPEEEGTDDTDTDLFGSDLGDEGIDDGSSWI